MFSRREPGKDLYSMGRLRAGEDLGDLCTLAWSQAGSREEIRQFLDRSKQTDQL